MPRYNIVYESNEDEYVTYPSIELTGRAPEEYMKLLRFILQHIDRINSVFACGRSPKDYEELIWKGLAEQRPEWWLQMQALQLIVSDFYGLDSASNYSFANTHVPAWLKSVSTGKCDKGTCNPVAKYLSVHDPNNPLITHTIDVVCSSCGQLLDSKELPSQLKIN